MDHQKTRKRSVSGFAFLNLKRNGIGLWRMAWDETYLVDKNGFAENNLKKLAKGG